MSRPILRSLLAALLALPLQVALAQTSTRIDPASIRPAPAPAPAASVAPVQAEAAAKAKIKAPAPLQLKTPSYIVMDYQTGKVLAEKNADQRRDPASLTKMMTSYVVFSEIKLGRVKLNDMVTVSEKAWRAKGTRSFLDVGSQVPVDVLLKGLMVQSGNDAAIALAEHVAGSEQVFAALMNQYAELLGMTNSHFVNAHGLSHKNHYSSARDLAKLGLAQMRYYPEYHALYATKEFTWNNIRQFNRNKLLWRDASVDGIKTGYTSKAKYCQVASAKRGDVRMVSVVMGAQSATVRTREVKALLDFGFNAVAAQQ